MDQKTIKALQECGNLMAKQLGYDTPVEMEICNPCEHKWDFSEPEVLKCKKCGFTEYCGEDDDDCGDCGVIGCAECDERYYENYDCGMMADGTCSKAGSEDCDFECPFRD